MKKILHILIATFVSMVLLLGAVFVLPAEPVHAMSGSGTYEDPYIITNAEELQNMNLNLSAYYALGGSIHCSETSTWNDGAGFEPIGDRNHPFTGGFDGRGYTISYLYINRPDEDRVGLFGEIDDASILYLDLTNVEITGGNCVGALVAWVSGGTVEHCNSSGVVVSSEQSFGYYAGGLVGRLDGALMWRCHSSCDVHRLSDASWACAGGLVGCTFYSNIFSSYSTGDVESRGSNIGGLVGCSGASDIQRCYSTSDVEITTPHSEYCRAGGFIGATVFLAEQDPSDINFIPACYARGDVHGVFLSSDPDYESCAGGFIGHNGAGHIVMCYSTGRVTGIANNEGGFCGYNNTDEPFGFEDNIGICFWDTDTSGTSSSDGGTGKSTVEMKTEDTFGEAGWNFCDRWSINGVTNDGYPFFQEVVDYKFNLLIEYAPVLRLHDDELFPPRSITSILYESDLKNGETIPGPIGDLMEDFNEDDYNLDMWEATSDHLCWEWWPPGPDLCADVPDPERFEEYPHIIGGREYEYPDYYVLQYWFFYPYNNWHNNHEGDWEMIAIFLDRETETPLWLTCAQHWDKKNYEWEDVELIGETHPVIYIAEGSHSSWANSGIQWNVIIPDFTSDNGLALYPEEEVDPSAITAADKAPYYLVQLCSLESWIYWRGRWGEDTIIQFSTGPKSPAKQGEKWDDPLAWADSPKPPITQLRSGSPVNLHAYDSYGNHVGITETGEIEAEIPGTYFYIPSAEDEEIMWIYTEEDLRCEIEATDAGEFELGIGRYITSQDKEVIVFYGEVLITENTMAAVELSLANPDFIMEVDLDGDETVDEYQMPNEITITYGENEPPIADPNGPYTGVAGSPVTLDGSGSYDPDGTIVSYEWDLDDDGEFDDATGAVVEYTWAEPYSGNIRLRVTDNEQATAITTTTATITEAAECTVTFNFVDQNGDLIGTGDERVYVDHHGWQADGDQIIVEPGTTVYYRAYYKQGSGLYGPKMSQVCDTSLTIDVPFYSLTMDFEDQDGDLIGTGNERVYVDHVGYKADGETVAVPLNSTVNHRAYYKQGSGLYGPKLTTAIDGTFNELVVMFREISFTVVDAVTQDPVSGAEVYADHVGYIENGGTAIVPLGGTIYHKAKVGSVWSEKTGKEIDESWAECIYEWDGVEFSPPSYE